MLKPGGGLGACDPPDGTKDAAPGLKEKLLALGLSPVLGWPLCKRLAGFTGGGAALSSQESPMMWKIDLHEIEIPIKNTSPSQSPLQSPACVYTAAVNTNRPVSSAMDDSSKT